MDELNFSKKNLKVFGLTMAAAFLLIGLFIFVRHQNIPLLALALSAVFFTGAMIVPRSLKLPYLLWMRLAFILSWVNTRLILVILFYLIFSPIGLIMRALGQDAMDRRLERAKSSYWKSREKKPFEASNFERQF